MKNMELLFNSAELRCRHETIPHPTPLCHSHYKTIYGIHNPWHLRINCHMWYVFEKDKSKAFHMYYGDSSHLAHDPNIHVQPTETNTINYKSFLDDLNQRIPAMAKQLLENDSTKQLDYSKLNIDKAIQNIDPILWEAIMNLTRSISENRGTSKLNDIHSDVYSLKRIRCFFILSTLLFCANNRCTLFSQM